jgi:hypothetical protein
MGQDNDVRVFDFQYIKGLEFEAVFTEHVVTVLLGQWLVVGQRLDQTDELALQRSADAGLWLRVSDRV